VLFFLQKQVLLPFPLFNQLFLDPFLLFELYLQIPLSLCLFLLFLLEHISSNNESLFHFLEYSLHFLSAICLHLELLVGLINEQLLLLLLL